MDYHRLAYSCNPGEPNCNRTSVRTSRMMDPLMHQPSHAPHSEHPHLFPTVDVPQHAHYIIGFVILIVGITGIVGNALVVFVFCRSRGLRTPSNVFVVNLAVADFLMSLTQAPVFFVASLHQRWVFGERACELYAFCGGFFGICSMMTLTAIAGDRCLAITRPLTILAGASQRKTGIVLAGVWIYALGWSLPPFFGWSAYVPEGLQTSCTWDYMTFTTSVRAYTILLFIFVFFIPLIIIGGCYVAIFRAIKEARREVQELENGAQKAYERMQNEWKMARVALTVILLFVFSWSPYSVVALTATAGYAHLLTPYMNSIPAVIAKASAIHNPIIYAIMHPKYRIAIAKCVPLLRPIMRVKEKDLRSSVSSGSASSRRPTLTSQGSFGLTSHTNARVGKTCLSSVSDSESCWTETEVDLSSVCSLPLVRRVSPETSNETAIAPIKERGNTKVFSSVTPATVCDGGVLEGGIPSDGKAFLLSGI